MPSGQVRARQPARTSSLAQRVVRYVRRDICRAGKSLAQGVADRIIDEIVARMRAWGRNYSEILLLLGGRCSVHAGERFATDGANQNRLRKVSKAPPLPLVSAGRRTPQLRAVNGLPTIRLASWHPAGHRAECAPVLAAVLAGSGMRPHPGRTNGWDAGMSEDREPRWLTYKAAARLLNMSPESLRARARREHWRKTMGNDGKALVLVPTDTAAIPAATQEDEPPASRPDNRPHPGRSDPALLARIAELEVRLAAMQAELMERTQRLGAAEGELELLRPELERTRGETERERGERVVERERADRLAGDVAELARKLAALVERVPPPSARTGRLACRCGRRADHGGRGGGRGDMRRGGGLRRKPACEALRPFKRRPTPSRAAWPTRSRRWSAKASRRAKRWPSC